MSGLREPRLVACYCDSHACKRIKIGGRNECSRAQALKDPEDSALSSGNASGRSTKSSSQGRDLASGHDEDSGAPPEIPPKPFTDEFDMEGLKSTLDEFDAHHGGDGDDPLRDLTNISFEKAITERANECISLVDKYVTSEDKYEKPQDIPVNATFLDCSMILQETCIFETPVGPVPSLSDSEEFETFRDRILRSLVFKSTFDSVETDKASNNSELEELLSDKR
ncbi:hypothetical protein SCHPADRAFT_896717 [Schizopora paradoxa]|uniref:Uncharacterized protein n=1 Tax=Schizopora paradoxa TaxID=27342 RepID=A0A0H2R5V4_9AGAM|nr:hypothetical protein SCHPADRAFT_896717 [Schizopora paradoxa]